MTDELKSELLSLAKKLHDHAFSIEWFVTNFERGYDVIPPDTPPEPYPPPY